MIQIAGVTAHRQPRRSVFGILPHYVPTCRPCPPPVTRGVGAVGTIDTRACPGRALRRPDGPERCASGRSSCSVGPVRAHENERDKHHHFEVFDINTDVDSGRPGGAR